MHGQQNIKFSNVQQAKQIRRYKNIIVKLYKTNAAVWYNKTCRHKQSMESVFITCMYRDAWSTKHKKVRFLCFDMGVTRTAVDGVKVGRSVKLDTSVPCCGSFVIALTLTFHILVS